MPLVSIAKQYEAARLYVAARVAAEDADKTAFIDAVIAADGAWHDLRRAFGHGCQCEAGSCPLSGDSGTHESVTT